MKKRPKQETITLSVTETVTYEFKIPKEKFAKNLRARFANAKRLRASQIAAGENREPFHDLLLETSDCVEEMIVNRPDRGREESIVSCDEREWSVLDGKGHEISNRKLTLVATADSLQKSLPFLRGEPVSFAGDEE